MGGGRADVSRTYNRYFLAHDSLSFMNSNFFGVHGCQTLAACMFSMIRVGELAGLYFGRAVHQAAQNHRSRSFLLDGPFHAVLNKSAASFQPRKRNIITPDKITEPGLITSLSAYFGAVPCVASKIA